MEKVLIKANEFTTNAAGARVKVPVGEQWEDKPKTHEEAIKKYGSEERLLTLAWESHVIAIQNQLRGGGDGMKAKINALLAKARAGTDPELTALAKRHDLI